MLAMGPTRFQYLLSSIYDGGSWFLLSIQWAKIFSPAVKSRALFNSILDLCQSFFLRHSGEKATRMGSGAALWRPVTHCKSRSMARNNK